MNADKRLAALEKLAQEDTAYDQLSPDCRREVLWATTELRKMVEAMRICSADWCDSRKHAQWALDAFAWSAETGGTR